LSVFRFKKKKLKKSCAGNSFFQKWRIGFWPQRYYFILKYPKIIFQSILKKREFYRFYKINWLKNDL